jgi:hypothetical protein
MEVDKWLKEKMEEYGRKVVKELAREYEFSEEEGLRKINITVKKMEEIKMKELSKIPLPFTGVICSDNCNGIRLNHSLYTQCTNKHTISHNGYNLCKTCDKQREKNSNDKPTYGYIQERIEQGENYVDSKGKKPVSYGNVMEKLNISRKEVEKEAEKVGIIIDEKHYEVKKGQRGRPKKSMTSSQDVIDTASESSERSEEPVKRGRGRPKKEKKTVEEEVQEEKEVKEEENESSDEEELAVTEFIYKGKKYLKAGDDTIYDIETHEEIGRWNGEKVILD